tara:strand:- start:7391 stop:7978 length:588 start_codon:yes stop_codon:yes gene_type:complete
MNQNEIQKMQAKIGVPADGFWGPRSADACRAHLLAMFPHPRPFPKQVAVAEFYGPHGTADGFDPPTKTITLPFPVFYDNVTVRVLHPHVKCADSLLHVFDRLAEAYPTSESRRAAGILDYGGLYNPRPMRGGSTWSMHSWAIAIDFNPEQNGNLMSWPVAAMMPLEVMECFAREGWTAAGAFWGRDAMHMQATSP